MRKHKLKRKFTLWCHDRNYAEHDEIGLTVLVCPFWVKILAIWLFSPSIYWQKRYSGIADAVADGLELGR